MVDMQKVIAAWFMTVSDTGNWFAALSRNDDGELILDWRVRYYKKGSPPDSEDESNWHRMLPVIQNEVELIEALRKKWNVLSTQATGILYEVLRGANTPEQFIRELRGHTWCNLEVTKDKIFLRLKECA
jgi:hypothetical protein